MLSSKTPMFFKPEDIRRVRRRSPDSLKPHTGRAILALVLAAIIFAGGFLIGARAETTVYCTGSSVRFRLAPVDGEVLAHLSLGDELTLLETAQGWAKVLWAGDQGWVSLDYLSQDKPGEAPRPATVAANGRVRLRDNPDGQTVGWLQNGEKVSVYGLLEGWARVEQGWVKKEYLEYGQ